ncbi:meiotic recombination protein REC114 isoform X2 [Neofelis nebulosa]|uniref:REC114 meiotic recombination protein n=1 Tax=Panthera leo TaxID=9689 RepID=A0A8C8WK50_PANLE|nr:meiotic recombination protein REC114 isoform X3 [Panthera leo]XP_058593091.1 meiotic recombination protein REC114 isoform X2 [Neofelis nebulosa]
MAEAGKEPAGLAFPGGGATQWPLQRYGRFMPSGTGEPPGPGQGAGTASSLTWKVFDSSEESGYLVLTIVISGHFFISQGPTLLNKSRMFRVQFSGGSKEQALESCCSCVQKLAQYVTVQEPDRVSQELRPSAGLLGAGESQGKDCAQRIPPQHRSHQKPEKQQQDGPAGTGTSGGRTSVSWLAQSLLVSEELSPVYEQSAWDTEDLRPFLRLCLMDQNFPAFVEEVEKELKKLTGLRN